MLLKLYEKFKSRKIMKKIQIGDNCRILTTYKNFGSEPYLVEIGDYCTVTSGVIFITHDGSIDVPFMLEKKSRWEGNQKYEKLGKIVIENNCFVGMNSIIMPGITIKKNSIIAAGSVVTKDVPSGKIVGGNPAKIIGTVEEYKNKIKNKIILIDHDNKEIDILNKI